MGNVFLQILTKRILFDFGLKTRFCAFLGVPRPFIKTTAACAARDWMTYSTYFRLLKIGTVEQGSPYITLAATEAS